MIYPLNSNEHDKIQRFANVDNHLQGVGHKATLNGFEPSPTGNRFNCCYDNLSRHENENNLFTSDWVFV